MAKQTTKRDSTPAEGGRNKKPAQPASEDQSGSTGRRTDTDGRGPGKDTGQDHYGQSGFGGKVRRPGDKDSK